MSGPNSISQKQNPSGRRSRIRPSKTASSLITTLLVLVVLSTIVVAFLQSMSIERSVARSSKNKLSAELAALAGLDAVKQVMQAGIGTDYGYSTILTNIGGNLAPVTTLHSGSNLNRVVPLVSGPVDSLLSSGFTNSTSLSNYFLAAAQTNSSNAFNANTKVGEFRILSNEADAPRYNAPWIYMTNSRGVAVSRFAYFVIDEQSKINLALHGQSQDTNRIGWTNVLQKIPVGIPGNTNYLTASETQKLLHSYSKESLPVMGQGFPSRSEYEKIKHIYTLNEIPRVAIVPSSFTDTNGSRKGFADAHKPKWNINDLATNTIWGASAGERAENIARIINSNLPNFKSRDIAFIADGKSTSQIRYIERIAASIVDYIDSDSQSTVLAGGEPAGKELAPVITSIAEKYNWISETGSGNLWTNSITQAVYVQLWNPYQTTVNGTLEFELFTPTEGGRFRFIEMAGAIQEPMSDVRGTNIVTLRPNEFKVYEMGKSTNQVVSSIQASLLQANHPRIGGTSSSTSSMPLHTRYRASWDGVLFDHTPNASLFFDSNGPGLQKSSVGGSSATLIALNGPSRFSVNYPQSVNIDASKGFRSVSDPRQNYLANYVWTTVPHTNNSVRWNGRNNSTNGETRQDFTTLFQRRDLIRSDPIVGTFVGNNDPTSAPDIWVSAQTNNVPAFMRNNQMASIGELGNIYDPVHLNDVGFATRAGTPDSWYASGGGRTLRMMQPDFNYPDTNLTAGSTERKSNPWNRDELRSLSLADLFTAIPNNNAGLPAITGKINLNTANRDVLAALFFGIGQSSDPAFLNSRMTSDGAFALADSVIAGRPYHKAGDFHRFLTNALASTNYSPLLGIGSTNVAQIMDPGREELLGALLEVMDHSSQAFTVVVIGQALDSKGRVVSQSILRSLIQVSLTKNLPGDSLKLSVDPVYVQQY